MNYIALSVTDLAIGAILILANGILSVALGLRLERTLLIATAGMIVQLVMLGYILTTLLNWYRHGGPVPSRW